VRNRHFAWALAVVVLIGATLSGVAAEPEIRYVIVDRDGVSEIEVTTPLASYIFSERGGVLKSLFLSFAPYGSTVAELVPGTKTDPKTLARQYVADAEFPFLLDRDRDGVRYRLLPPAQPDPDTVVIEFVGTFDDATITKRYRLRADAFYTMDVDLVVDNASGEPIEIGMALGNHIPKSGEPGLVYLFDDKPGTDLLARGSYISFDGLGLMDKSVVFFLSPVDGTGVSPLVERTPAGSQRFGASVRAGEGASTYRFSLYGGRRRYLPMEDAGLAELDQPGYGARSMIPVIQFLNMLYRVTGNYGWAIILFTLLTRVILFPLMRKQYHSMAKMQRIQPKLKQIQQRFKDDRQLMQQKLLELYRKEGVNPMGGCLPMLIQLPIIFLIWRAILYASEQIHLSPGFLWIPDLSLHDPYFILVILTTAAMIVQQWLMTPPTAGESSGSQKLIGYIFPVFMAILLWKFPAGLWLYYLLTTVAQVGQQAFVNWEMARADAGRLAPVAAADDDLGSDDGSSEAGG